MFKKYNSIENSYRQEFLEKIKNHGFENQTFVVQEKAHGANLSYWTKDGINFHAAKRTEQLQTDEKFYNYEIVLRDLKPKFSRIWDTIYSQNPNIQQLTFFGEIIGGDYPHEAVSPVKKAIGVQKGIYYSPNNHFYAFDIMIDKNQYLDVEIVNRLFEREEILHAKTLYQGSLPDCLNYPNTFESTIPSMLGLPVLTPNICEGVIIRPSSNLHMNNGTRVILKNKNEKWSENKRFHKSIKKQEEISVQIIELQEAIATYITENRLNNLLSKIGTFTEKDFGKILGLFNKDIVEDFLKDFAYITDDLEKKELKLVTKSIGKITHQMVKNLFQN